MIPTSRTLRPIRSATLLLLALAAPRARGDEQPTGVEAAALAGAVADARPLAAFTDGLKLTLGADAAAARPAPVWYHLQSPFDDPAWQPRAGSTEKNSWLALGEVVGINFGMWFVSYWAGNDFSKIGFDTIGQNFRKGWIIDTDPYWVNQFGHPYEGHAFYTAARSTGHSFYESFAFSFLGSVMWEQIMEVQSPSINDQVTTPGGGTVMGEILWRLHRLILDSSNKPSAWRQFAAFAVSPVAGVNRFVFGEKYEGPILLPPSWMGEFHFGTLIAGSETDLRTGATTHRVGPWLSIGAHINYGVPGSPGLRLKQPFDHFDFLGDFSFTNTAQRTGSLLMRGVVVGETFGPATDWGGLWGLFGSYDVISIPVFEASGLGLGPGVSLMKRWGTFEAHGTAYGGLLPWGSGGAQEPLFARDYHVGPGAFGLVELRGIFGDRATLDLQAREYYISGAYAQGQSEDITWARVALTVRIYGPHGVSGAFNVAHRHATYQYQPSDSQRGTTYAAYYTLLDGW